MPKKKVKLYQATESFAVGRRIVHRGDLVPSDDPVFEGRAHLFAEVQVPEVEKATAAPGETRAVKAPKPANDE